MLLEENKQNYAFYSDYSETSPTTGMQHYLLQLQWTFFEESYLILTDSFSLAQIFFTIHHTIPTSSPDLTSMSEWFVNHLFLILCLRSSVLGHWLKTPRYFENFVFHKFTTVWSQLILFDGFLLCAYNFKDFSLLVMRSNYKACMKIGIFQAG